MSQQADYLILTDTLTFSLAGIIICEGRSGVPDGLLNKALISLARYDQRLDIAAELRVSRASVLEEGRPLTCVHLRGCLKQLDR